MDISALVEAGSKLGLAGDVLKEWVSEQQNIARELRLQDRELEREKIERIKKESELEHLKLNGNESQKETSVSFAGVSSKIPLLPSFNDAKDDLDAYVSRFERFASSQNWPRVEWGTHFSALLTGKALEVYSRLAEAEIGDYDKLKCSLLKHYKLTEEGYRLKFRESKPESLETGSQFLARIESHFNRWVELSNVGRNFVGVRDLFLREQFLRSCSKELSIFLKERSPKTALDMAELADMYREAHECGLSSSRNGQRSSSLGSMSDGQNGSRRCYNCGSCFHLKTDCPDWEKGDRGKGLDKNSKGKGRGAKVGYALSNDRRYVKEDTLTGEVSKRCTGENSLPVVEGFVNGKAVSVLRDTGCTGIVIKSSLVDRDQFNGESQSCTLLDGSVVTVPQAIVDINTPYFSGIVKALCFEKPLYDLIVGNIPGARNPNMPEPDWKPYSQDIEKPTFGAVQTRSQKARQEQGIQPLKVPSLNINFDAKDFQIEQRQDESIKKFRYLAVNGGKLAYPNGGESSFVFCKDLLYRMYRDKHGKETKQLVVPQKFRDAVLKVAHETVMGGHLGVNKTVAKIYCCFFWPKLTNHVNDFCRSCEICQKTFPGGRVTKVPLQNLPLVDITFQRFAVDLIGSIHPVTDRGNRYILTYIDYATRYPEAVALPSIETERVAEALVEFYARLGIPDTILSDQGRQFISDVMKEVNCILSIRQLVTTPYHPSCNGLVERFNGTLKNMLKKMCSERPKDWDRYINPLLFAYREVPQASTGFSPFELLYGRTARGPMQVLKELWSGQVVDSDVKSSYQYILDLQERLETTCKLAQQELKHTQARQKRLYDRSSKPRSLQAGDQVLVLLPTDTHKLLMQWKGPYKVIERVRSSDYKVQFPGKVKTLHINLLKKFVSRNEPKTSPLFHAAAAVIEEMPDEEMYGNVETPSLIPKETEQDVVVYKGLSSSQNQQARRLLSNFSDVFSDVPGKTDMEFSGRC